MTTKFDVGDTIKFEITGRIVEYLKNETDDFYQIKIESELCSAYPRQSMLLNIDSNNPTMINAERVNPSEFSTLETEANRLGYKLIKVPVPRYKRRTYPNYFNGEEDA